MIHIAYIELDTHPEIAQSFNAVSKDTASIQVDYYFSEKMASLVKIEHNTFISTKDSIISQLKTKPYHLVIIGTAHRYFSTFNAVCKAFNTVLIVHNIHFSTLKIWNLFFNIFKEDVVYRLKLLLKEGLLLSPTLHRNAGKLMVLDEHLANENHHFLPLFYSRPHIDSSSDFSVVIPGSVSEKRRKYSLVFSVISTFHQRYPEMNGKIKWVFLGRAKGKELEEIKRVEQELPAATLVYYTHRVSNEEFDEKMKNATLLWCPLQVETHFFSNKEVYGKSKMTGNWADAIHYQKKVIFPKSYTPKAPFIIHEKIDVALQIKNAIYQEKTQDFELFDAYQKNKIQTELMNLLSKLITL